MQDAADTLTMPTSPGTLPRLSRYELLREAGRGGMSVVYEARNRRTGETVAVKVLNEPPGLTPDQAQDLLSRFTREARTVAGLTHPNVITIHGMDEEAGQHFLVMEFLRGETLRERLLRGPMTPDQAEPVLRQVAGALDAVHARGVVHRDLKPSNVMLMLDGTAKLLDFGIARRSDDAAITGALIGSPAYMAPEQARGGAGTPASDIWALGALLYEMLAGRPPFVGKSIPDVLRRVTHEPPAPIPDLPEPIQRVLHRALDKHPERRYPTARALTSALRASLPGYQIERKRLLPPWAWGVLLVPILLGASLVLLSRYHPFVPAPSLTPLAPVVNAPPTAGVPPAPPAPVPARAPRHAMRRLVSPRVPHPALAAPPRHAVKQMRRAAVKAPAAAVRHRTHGRATHAMRRIRLRRHAVIHVSAWRAALSPSVNALRPRAQRVILRARGREPRHTVRRLPIRQTMPPAPSGRGPYRRGRRGEDDTPSEQGLERYIYSPEGTGM